MQSRMTVLAITVVLVGGGAASIAGAQTTYYVNGTCGDDGWTGLDPNCVAPDGPKRTIQAGIDAASTGDTVIVADGTYAGVGNRNLDFGGKDITLRSQNGPDNCIIDSNSGGRGFYFHSGEGPMAIMEGFTISGGYEDTGAGIKCVGSSPTIRNCKITGCFAASQGAGIHADSGSDPLIVDCTLHNNSCDASGGGIFCYRATISHCTVTSNTAYMAGGGILCTGSGGVSISYCTVMGNTGGSGGGIDAGRNVSIQNCLISGNRSFGFQDTDSRGGGIYSHGNGNRTIRNCLIIGNRATDTENIAKGGGIYAADLGTVYIINSTIADNLAAQPVPGYGGGMYAGSGNVQVRNCILWVNTPESVYVASVPPDITYSDVQGGWPDTGNINMSPLFVDPPGGDYHLSTGSPCIDAGDPNFVPEPAETDIDGDPRVVAGRVDMGSDEFVIPGDFDFDGDVDLDDFGVFAACYNGANNPPAPSCPPGVDADLDGDGDVDLDDFSIFAASYTGSL